MPETTNYAKLSAMLAKFGVVTVMDVKIYDTKRFSYKNGKIVDGDGNDAEDNSYDAGEWDAKSTLKTGASYVALDTLKITNLNSEGPNKTATGGMAADVLLKYGKKFTLEMQEAMGRYDVLTSLYGANISKNDDILAITDRFAGEKTIVGTTFVIDQATGAKQPLNICIPIFLCDSIFNLTQDAEGDVTTFDLNGDVLRFEKDGIGKPGVDGKYEKGADNSFYFFATYDGMNQVATKGYREAFSTERTTTGA